VAPLELLPEFPRLRGAIFPSESAP